jgi:hypothetical protein
MLHHQPVVGIGDQRQRVSPAEPRRQTTWNARVSEASRALLLRRVGTCWYT